MILALVSCQSDRFDNNNTKSDSTGRELLQNCREEEWRDERKDCQRELGVLIESLVCQDGECGACSRASGSI